MKIPCWTQVWYFTLLVVSIASSGSQAWSAQTANWPCVQRKVPEISVAAVWRGPPIEAPAGKWRDDRGVADIVQRLSVRRTSEEEAVQAIAQFAVSSGAQRQTQLLKVVAGLVETVNAERAEVIAGLERFGDGQKQLAELVRKENAEMANLQNKPDADPSEVARRTERLTWNLRIFEERQKSLRFVCEVPTLIEQRLFALSGHILKALESSP